MTFDQMIANEVRLREFANAISPSAPKPYREIDAARAEFERVTGQPANRRYGAKRLREETAKHNG